LLGAGKKPFNYLSLLFILLTFRIMSKAFLYNIFPCGDHAATVDFGNVIDETVNRHVLQLFKQLKQKNITGVKDVIPAYSSATVVYDVFKIRTNATHATAYHFIQQQIENVLAGVRDDDDGPAAIIKIPACYDEPFAPDIQELALQKNITVNDVVKIHTGKTYRVFMLGFVPGFAYMGTVDELISLPRRATPRTMVAQGSIGIAGLQTGIYPLDSPGGWNIIAQTPVKIFDAEKETPVLLQAGDYVQFYAINTTEFNKIKALQ
jgi:inhibitor of KinA